MTTWTSVLHVRKKLQQENKGLNGEVNFLKSIKCLINNYTLCPPAIKRKQSHTLSGVAV
jgi:hypothetical protein